MDQASLQFVAFGLLFAILSNFSRSRAWRSAVLLLASLVFIGLLAKSAIVLIPLVGFLLIGYLGLVALERGWTKSLSWGLLLVIFVYLWLKKYTFLPRGIFLNFPYFTLGLSYIFFRVLHLLIEAGDSEEKPSIRLVDYLLYTLNFTTLDQYAQEPIELDAGVVGMQLERIVRGFFKVNVLAILLHAVQQDALTQLSQPLPMSLKLFPAFRLVIVYPFFLYANFSGYIDIVIAIARLMRVRLPENFDRPFSAASFLDFWNRWHITLSSWLKAYVYNPLFLALMRRSSQAMAPILGVLCFFVTFFLVGIWHGRTSEFVLFGIFQGGGVAINKLWQIWLTNMMGRKGYKTLAANPLYTAFARGMTFSWFAFTLFWFWANWRQIGTIFHALAVAQWIGVWLAVWLSATAVLALWEQVRAALLSISTHDGPVLTSWYARVMYTTSLAFVAFILTILLNQPAPDIVYKAF
jgi:alginate O-acetyltransferase complex protein AlgI